MSVKTRRGSITVFAALSIMLVAQLLFTLLAAARNVEFCKVLQMNTDAVLESMFADYVSPLWENYHLLGASVQDSQGEFSLTNREAMLRNLSKANLGGKRNVPPLSMEGNSLLCSDMTDVAFTSYLLMTDQQGKVFQAAVTAYMKQNLAYELAKTVYSNYESVKEVKEDYGDGDASIGNALDALDSIKASGQAEGKADARSAGGRDLKGASMQNTETKQAAANEEDNLLTTVVETQRSGILTLVLPEDAKISGAKMNLKKAVSHRTLASGTAGRVLAGDWYDQVLMNQYLVQYLADYTDKATGRGLNYELEYLIGGRSEDAANLKIAVTEILAIREAMNFASLAASPQKQSQAFEMALLLAGATANPLVIEAVKYGLLAAWAYAESILDLRTLLQGGRIAAIKSDADWTSELSAIPSLLSGWSQAKSSAHGVSYTDYLGMLLFFHSGDKLAMRAMDVEEATIRQVEGYEAFRMDCVVCEATINATYEYAPVFLSFVSMLPQKNEHFCRMRTAGYSYLEPPQSITEKD